MDNRKDYSRGIFVILLFFALAGLAAILKLTASVTIPIVIAMLTSLVFEPLLERLNKKLHIPWAVGIILVFLLVFIVLYIVTTLIFTSCKTILAVYPKYEERFLYIYSQVAEIFKLPFDKDTSLFENLWSQLGVRNIVQNIAVSFSTTLITYVSDFIMIFLFSAFFLIELRNIRQKIDYAASMGKAEFLDTDTVPESRAGSMIKDIIEQVTAYLSVKFFVSLLTGVLVFVLALVLGLDFAIVWAFLAFVLNFIPNFGSIISVVLTTVFALVQFWPSPLPVILTAVFMTAINFGIGNILEPRIEGKNLGLSPFAILVSLSAWGWIWGFAGLVLAIPMMVIMKIICENYSFLRPFAVIIGSWPPSQKNGH